MHKNEKVMTQLNELFYKNILSGMDNISGESPKELPPFPGEPSIPSSPPEIIPMPEVPKEPKPIEIPPSEDPMEEPLPKEIPPVSVLQKKTNSW